MNSPFSLPAITGYVFFSIWLFVETTSGIPQCPFSQTEAEYIYIRGPPLSLIHARPGGCQSVVSPGSCVPWLTVKPRTLDDWESIPNFLWKQSGNLRCIIHIKILTAEQTLRWVGFYLSARFPPLSMCSISGGPDRWIALPPQCWMYGCTQLVLRNNVITPINSRVMLAPPANRETKLSLSLLSLFTLSAHRSVEMQYHSSA